MRLGADPQQLDAVAAAFRKLALDEAMNPPRQRVQTEKVLLHVLPAAQVVVPVPQALPVSHSTAVRSSRHSQRPCVRQTEPTGQA